MDISSATSLPKTNSLPARESGSIAKTEVSQSQIKDRFESTSLSEPIYKPSPKDTPKVFGAVGAAIGQAIGKIVLPLGLAVAAGVAAAAVLGPVGAVVAGGVAVAGGAAAEKFLHPGGISLGMAGGTVGSAVGKIAEQFDYTPSAKNAEAAKDFSIGKLFGKLQNPKFTSNPKISLDQALELKTTLKPGDIIIGNNDDTMAFEYAQKVGGATGNWTHACIVKDQNTVMETLIPSKTDRSREDGIFQNNSTNERGFVTNTPEAMITRNHHLMIIRPNYKNEEEVKKVIEEGEKFKDAKYDVFFNLKSDDRLYCTEFVYKTLQKAAPDIKIEPNSFLGIKFVTADNFAASEDMQIIYTTGSDLAANIIHKYA